MQAFLEFFGKIPKGLTSSDKAELAEKYPDQWAGDDENGPAATASTRTELIETLKCQGTDLKTAAICLLETNSPILIL